MEEKTASCLLGNLVCCRCAVQDDLGKNAVCSAADPAPKICTNLAGNQVGVRPLCGENQMDTKGSALPCDNIRAEGKVCKSFFDALVYLRRLKFSLLSLWLTNRQPLRIAVDFGFNI